MGEVRASIGAVGEQALADWRRLESDLSLVRDQFVVDWPVVFAPAKDRPVLFTALAFTDVLLTLDKRVSMPNLKFSTESISLRMPLALLNAIRREANRNDIPYQSLIKLSLAEKFGS